MEFGFKVYLDKFKLVIERFWLPVFRPFIFYIHSGGWIRKLKPKNFDEFSLEEEARDACCVPASRHNSVRGALLLPHAIYTIILEWIEQTGAQVSQRTAPDCREPAPALARQFTQWIWVSATQHAKWAECCKKMRIALDNTQKWRSLLRI